MTRLQREKYAAKCIKRVIALYPGGIEIRLRTRYDKGTMGYCITEPEYMRAVININIDDVTAEKDIAKTVFHEVLHIPLWELFSVGCDLAKGSNEPKFAKRQVNRANEVATSRLEEMFFTLVFPEFE